MYPRPLSTPATLVPSRLRQPSGHCVRCDNGMLGLIVHGTRKHTAEANFRATPAKESDRVWVYFENIVCRQCRRCGGICVWHAGAAEQTFSRLLLDELRMGEPARRYRSHAGKPGSGRPGPQTASCRQQHGPTADLSLCRSQQSQFDAIRQGWSQESQRSFRFGIRHVFARIALLGDRSSRRSQQRCAADFLHSDAEGSDHDRPGRSDGASHLHGRASFAEAETVLVRRIGRTL